MAILSNIITNEKLISYEKWCEYIDSLRTSSTIEEEEKAIKLLAPLFLDAVEKRLPNKKFGIFFSGGVDSTLIAYTCKKFTDDFVCYTVGIEGSQDIEFSKKVSRDLKLKHITKTLSQKEIELLFEKTARMLGKDFLNVVNLGVGAVELAAIELAKKHNISVFFSGLGSEEIFAGYQRHANSNDINEECWQGLKTTWERDFNRDYRIADATGSEFLTPFLDKELIKIAMQISEELKIYNEYKKYILRKTAVSMGLPEKFAFRPKKAAQYGSGFDKVILKIAKSKNFKYKQEYIRYLIQNLGKYK